ncbi:MAG TPA: IPT/TIG domain-containing protein [Bryobacteraceae bacterium]|jgi:hypothetical protein
MRDRDNGLPIEHFIQALTSQLDRAQNAMALKARAGLPLTFAVKELSLDLRTHVEMIDSAVRIRPAGPGEGDSSTLHLSLTTITRPMIEENTFAMISAPDEPSIRDVAGKDISEEEQRRLEWAGIHTVSQLVDLQRKSGEEAIERVAQIPVMRLRAALARAAEPSISHIMALDHPDGNGASGSTLLRVSGRNLTEDGELEVRVNGERVPVIRGNDRELVVAALPHHTAGTLSLETQSGTITKKDFRLPVAAAQEPTS